MKIFATILLTLSRVGCVVYPINAGYEPTTIIGLYPVGYYYPGYGYWTGYGWDINFYAYGHPGWGHYYRGAPRSAWGPYHSTPHYRH